MKKLFHHHASLPCSINELRDGFKQLAAFACFKALVDHELYTIQF